MGTSLLLSSSLVEDTAKLINEKMYFTNFVVKHLKHVL